MPCRRHVSYPCFSPIVEVSSGVFVGGHVSYVRVGRFLYGVAIRRALCILVMSLVDRPSAS